MKHTKILASQIMQMNEASEIYIKYIKLFQNDILKEIFWNITINCSTITRNILYRNAI